MSFFFGLDGNQLAHSLGEWSLFWIRRLNPLAATLQCTAGIVLRRRHSGSTWTVLQVFFQLGALWQCTFEKLLYSCGRRPLATHFTDFACCARIVLPFDLARYSCLPSDELGEWWTTTGHLPGHMWPSLPQPRSCSPQGGRHNSNLAANNTLSLLMNTPFGTRQFLLVLDWTPEQEPVRGLWEAKTQLCTANAFFCCLSAATIKNACFTWLGSNQFVWCIILSCDTVALYHCVHGKSLFVVVFVGPCPFCFLLCFSAGWRNAYLAGGSAFRLLCGCFCVFCLVLICHATWPQVSM